MIGSIFAKQEARRLALEELVELADSIGPIARRLEGKHGDQVSAYILGRAEGRIRILASTLGAKSVEPRLAVHAADPDFLEVIGEADRFLAGIEDNALAGDARPVRERLQLLAKLFGVVQEGSGHGS